MLLMLLAKLLMHGSDSAAKLAARPGDMIPCPGKVSACEDKRDNPLIAEGRGNCAEVEFPACPQEEAR